MRCNCCNRALSNQEATSKFSSGVYTDMCNKCLSTIAEDVVVEEDTNLNDIEEDSE